MAELPKDPTGDADPDEVERQTVWFCAKHLQRVKKAGNRGFEHKGIHYKVGFW